LVTRDHLDHAAYETFQTLLRSFGDPAFVRLKRR
jgi:hypothetical protein